MLQYFLNFQSNLLLYMYSTWYPFTFYPLVKLHCNEVTI